MTKKKAAYQFDPIAFYGSTNVLLMTLEQQGAYRRLLDHHWLNDSIPSDLWELATICKNVPLSRMRKIWRRVGQCFSPSPDLPGRLVANDFEFKGYGPLLNPTHRTAVPVGERTALAARFGCAPGECIPVKCAYCDTHGVVIWETGGIPRFSLQIDHVHPVALGGNHSVENLTIACRKCNGQKSAKPLDAFLAGRSS